MSEPRPRYASFQNPFFRGALALSLAVTLGLLLKNGCSPTGPIRIYTPGNPIPPDNAGVEVVQILSYLTACLTAFGFALVTSRRRWFFVAYAAYFLLFIMEETDWLQQIFNYPTPDFFLAHSTKNVVNLHNLNLLFDTGRSTAGILLSRLLLAAPGLVFGIWCIWRAIRGDFLGKAPLAALLVVFVLDFFPKHSVFQLLFGFFAVAYPAILWSVDREREARDRPTSEETS